MVLDGAMTGEWFTAHARQILTSTLRPGDIVILDNLAAHRGRCGPGSHPGCGRDTAVPAARTIGALWDMIRDALPQFPPQECASHLTAAGYEPD
nr:hypothetical protein [Pseudoroseomonas aestuarii]